VNLGEALVAGSQAAKVVQVGQAALDHPALAPETRAVAGAPTGDHRRDAASSEQATVLVVVIAAIGHDPVGLLPGPAGLAGHRPAVQALQQRDELGDVVAVAAGQRDGQRDS